MAGQIALKAGSAVNGLAKGTGSTVGYVLSALFLKWRVTLTVIFLLIHLSGAVAECIEEKNIRPLIFDVGFRIASGDETQYWKIKEIEANGWKLPTKSIEIDEEEGFWRDLKSIFAKVGFFFDLIANLWYVYILWYLFFIIIDKFNTSGKVFSGLFALIAIIVIQAMYGQAMLYLNYECSIDDPGSCLDYAEKVKQVGFAMTPLKGVGLTIYHTFVTQNLLPAFTEGAVPYMEQVLNKSINLTTADF